MSFGHIAGNLDCVDLLIPFTALFIILLLGQGQSGIASTWWSTRL